MQIAYYTLPPTNCVMNYTNLAYSALRRLVPFVQNYTFCQPDFKYCPDTYKQQRLHALIFPNLILIYVVKQQKFKFRPFLQT